MPRAAPGGIIAETPPADNSEQPRALPSLPSVPVDLVGGAATTVAAAGLFVFVFRNRHRSHGGRRDEGRERRPSGVGDAGRVLAMSRALHRALLDSDFADTRIVLVRETDRFLEFTLDCPPGDANALVVARHILSRQFGCSVDGTEVAQTQVRHQAVHGYNRLASDSSTNRRAVASNLSPSAPPTTASTTEPPGVRKRADHRRQARKPRLGL